MLSPTAPVTWVPELSNLAPTPPETVIPPTRAPTMPRTDPLPSVESLPLALALTGGRKPPPYCCAQPALGDGGPDTEAGKG